MASSDHISKGQFHMHLYHGTTSDNLSRIKAAGLGGHHSDPTSVYLTNDYEGLARYYADTAANQEGGDPVILTVRANPRNLVVDWNSFDDPVHAAEYDGNYHSFDPSKLRHEGKDWKNSLRQTGSVLHLGKIAPEDIVDIDKY